MKQHPLLKQFYKYVSFNVLGMLGLSCYILADTFFISKGLGALGLTALNLALPVFSFIQGISLMLGVGGGIKYAVAKSSGDQKTANKIFSTTLILSALFSVIFVLIGAFASNELTTVLNADAEVYDMTHQYLQIILLFAPAFIFSNVIASFVRNDGNPRLSMFATLFGSLFNIVFDYVLIFNCGLGILGAVLATGIAPLTGIIICGFHWALKKGPICATKPDLKPKTVFSVFSLGLPSLVTEFAGGIVMIVFNNVILSLEGNIGVSAYGVVANIAFVILSMYSGVAQGVQPLLSEAHGKHDLRGKDTLLKYSLITVGVVSAVIYAFIAGFSPQITDIFNSDKNETLAAIAEFGMIIYFIGSIFASFNAIFSTYFASIEKPIPSQAITILKGLVIIIPFIYLFSHFLGMTGVWLAYVITEALVLFLAVAIYVIFRLRTKKRIMLEEQQEIEEIIFEE